MRANLRMGVLCCPTEPTVSAQSNLMSRAVDCRACKLRNLELTQSSTTASPVSHVQIVHLSYFPVLQRKVLNKFWAGSKVAL